jgi:hypothetical protein
MLGKSTADIGKRGVCRLSHQRSFIHCETQNENPPRISPGGPTSSAPSQLPVHPRSAALSRATELHIGCNRDESMTPAAEPIDAVPIFAEHSHARSGHELVSSIGSNNLCGESEVESCQDRSCCCLRALHRWSWRNRDAPRKLTRKDGWRLQRIPRDVGVTRSGSEPRRERRPRPCGAAAPADAISRKQRGLAVSPMWRAVRADIGTASTSVARRTRLSPRPGADAGWERRLERAES